MKRLKPKYLDQAHPIWHFKYDYWLNYMADSTTFEYHGAMPGLSDILSAFNAPIPLQLILGGSNAVNR